MPLSTRIPLITKLFVGGQLLQVEDRVEFDRRGERVVQFVGRRLRPSWGL